MARREPSRPGASVVTSLPDISELPISISTRGARGSSARFAGSFAGSPTRESPSFTRATFARAGCGSTRAIS